MGEWGEGEEDEETSEGLNGLARPRVWEKALYRESLRAERLRGIRRWGRDILAATARAWRGGGVGGGKVSGQACYAKREASGVHPG